MIKIDLLLYHLLILIYNKLNKNIKIWKKCKKCRISHSLGPLYKLIK